MSFIKKFILKMVCTNCFTDLGIKMLILQILRIGYGFRAS